MDFTGLFTGKNNTSSIGTKNNISKNHYFIGSVINDDILIEKLKLVRKKLISKYSIKELHYPNIISTNLIYLGYFTMDVAKLYMEKIISYLCKSVTNNLPKMECSIKNFKMTYDQTYYRIMLQLEDNKSSLKNVIIPYLQKKGIENIYGNKKYEQKSSIDIIYFKESKKIEEQKKRFKRKFKILLDYPLDKFIIDKLVLIQGTPVITRSGTPSTHDQLDYKVIKEYEYEFKGSNNSNMNQKNNLNNNSNNKNNNVNKNTNANNANVNRNKNNNVNNVNGNVNRNTNNRNRNVSANNRNTNVNNINRNANNGNTNNNRNVNVNRNTNNTNNRNTNNRNSNMNTNINVNRNNGLLNNSNNNLNNLLQRNNMN